MEPTVAVLVLASATLHPIWNALVKRDESPERVFFSLLVLTTAFSGGHALLVGEDLSIGRAWPFPLISAAGLAPMDQPGAAGPLLVPGEAGELQQGRNEPLQAISQVGTEVAIAHDQGAMHLADAVAGLLAQAHPDRVAHSQGTHQDRRRTGGAKHDPNVVTPEVPQAAPHQSSSGETSAHRRLPSRSVALTTTGTPKPAAMRDASGSSRLARICG